MADGNASSDISLNVAVELIAPAVEKLARHAGIRALIIKGPVATHHGLRPARASADIDVLVEPGRAYDLVDALEACGWKRRPMTRAAELAASHSESLIHPRWPIDIDVHAKFPGFLAGEPSAFEALWRDRTAMSLAGTDCTVAGLHGSIIIALLHAIRPDAIGHQRTDEHRLALAAVARMTRVDQERFVDIVVDSGAAGALVGSLREVGLTVPVPGGQDATAWDALVASKGSFTGQVLAAASTAHGGQRVKVLWLALWPSATELRAAYEGEGHVVRSVTWLRLQRLGRGLRALPGALRALARARREAKHSGEGAQ